jgi:hypothetical protein
VGQGERWPLPRRDLADNLLNQLGKLPDDTANATIQQLRQLRDRYAFVLQQPNYSILNVATHETADREDIDPHKAADVIDALKKMAACLGTG